MKNGFTPTQDLILEVLIARKRLGENLWTFSSKVTKQVEALETAGWVWCMHGIVENTIRAGLTEKGIARWLSYDYPEKNKVEGWDELIEEAKALKEKFGGENFWLEK